MNNRFDAKAFLVQQLVGCLCYEGMRKTTDFAIHDGSFRLLLRCSACDTTVSYSGPVETGCELGFIRREYST